MARKVKRHCLQAKRRQAALVRLRKYTGEAEGYEPLTELFRRYLTFRLEVDGLIMPYAGEIEQDLERGPTMVDGIPDMLDEAGSKANPTRPLVVAIRRTDAGLCCRH